MAPRQLDAYCTSCSDVRSCAMRPEDPGSCTCTVCGAVILLMKPLRSPDSLPEPPGGAPVAPARR